ncbi:shK domain-like domain-containing protein [Ditylenchus destructor]|nr:shK domain-like domain-containing protein [Ditylenchus destructor]
MKASVLGFSLFFSLYLYYPASVTAVICPPNLCDLLEADVNGTIPFLAAVNLAFSQMSLVQQTTFLPIKLQLEAAVNADNTCQVTLQALRFILNGLSLGAIRTLLFGTSINLNGVLWASISVFAGCDLPTTPPAHTTTTTLLSTLGTTQDTCPDCPPVCQGGGSEDPSKSCPRTQCLDLYSECAGWAKLGYCKANPERAHYMEKNCPVSCEYCEEICEDYDCPEVCLNRTLSGDCLNDPEYMLVLKNPPVTAILTNLHIGCPFANSGCGSTDPATVTHLYFYCRPTCGLCDPVSECTTVEESTLGKCPRDWIWSNETNKCYWATPNRGHWVDIENTCEQNGGVLVSIHSLADNNQFTQLPSPPPGYGGLFYYIGLYRGASGWSDPHWQDNTAVDFGPRWAAGQPDGTLGEDYGAILLNGGGSTGFWHDVVQRPEDLYPGFCQKPVCVFPTPSVPPLDS